MNESGRDWSCPAVCTPEDHRGYNAFTVNATPRRSYEDGLAAARRLCLIARATVRRDVFRTSILNEKVEKYDTGNCEVV
jgi:hypothetical protein